MCYTDNSAVHTTVFLNAQLSSLWENSAACAKKLDLSRQTTANRYAVALAKYSSGRGLPQDTVSLPHDFDATFNKPSLRFVCNHNAILRLSIAEGQYHDIAITPPNGRSPRAPGKPGKTKQLKGVEIDFRIPFQLSSIQGGTSMIGDSHDNFKFLSLDFSAPQLCSISSSVEEDNREAVVFYLKGYLKFLQKAGHHILYCLPEFNDAGLRYTVDFSAAVEAFLGVDKVFHIPTQKINDYLAASWLNAILPSDTSGTPSSTGAGLALTQYLSTWSSTDFGIHFDILFSAPTVKALCSQEVLVTFNIQTVSFYESNDLKSDTPFQTFTDWKFSFLSTVEHQQSQGGASVVRLVHDQSSFLYMDSFSEFPGYDAINDVRDLKSRLKDFFEAEYLPRIESEELSVLYNSKVSFALPSTDDPDDPETLPGNSETEADTRISIRRESDIGAYDIVSAISQASVNQHFRSCWESSHTRQTAWNSIAIKWTYSKAFEAEFKPVTAWLLSNERAIIVLHIATGRMNVVDKGFDSEFDPAAAPYAFSNWRVAFEVPLIKCTHEDIPGVTSSWKSRFQETMVFKQNDSGRATFHHIYADFRAPQYVRALSQFGSLFSGRVERASAMKVKALITLMREQYLPSLMAAGYHVVHTIPVWRGGNGPIGGFTNFHFRTVSESVVTRDTFKDRSRSSNPVIIVAGMSSAEPLPQSHLDLPESFDWLIGVGSTMCSGVVTLSHRLFLPDLLSACSIINRTTALVPYFTGTGGTRWGLQLVPLAKDQECEEVSSDFELENDCTVEGRRYGWQYQRGWTMQQQRKSVHRRAPPQYTTIQVSCNTDNRLIIPTTYNHELLDIRIEGRVELSISCGVEQSDSWTASAVVNWASYLRVRTDQGHLDVSVHNTEPIHEGNTIEGYIDPQTFCDPTDLLMEYFVESPGLDDLAALFRQFVDPSKSSYPGEGAFSLTHPSFNKNGDLFFELQPYFRRDAPPSIQLALNRPDPSESSNSLVPRGRFEHRGSSEYLATSSQRSHSHSQPRSEYSRSRAQGSTNGRVSPAHSAHNSHTYLHGSEESDYYGGQTLGVPRASSSSIHWSRGNTPTNSRPPSPRQGYSYGGLTTTRPRF